MPSFFLSAPANTPLTVCGLQPVASTIWAMVAPCLRRSIAITCACLVPSRVFGAGAASAPVAAALRGRPRFFGAGSTAAVSAAIGARLDADRLKPGSGDQEQHAAAVRLVAPDGVHRCVGSAQAVGDPLADQAAGEQRADHLGGGAAAQRAG